MAIDYQSSFNSGELSGRMNGRSSLEVYNNGCSRLENFFVLPQGGVERRTGTEFIAETNSGAGDKRVRMIPFIFSSTQSYAVEFGDGYITVWNGDVPILVTDSSPYSDTDLDDIDVRQRFDIMYIQHPNKSLYELRRETLDPTFSIQELQFDYPPLLEPNDTDITMSPSAVEGTITLTSSQDFFSEDHVGAYMAFEVPRSLANATISGTLTSTDISNPLYVSNCEWDFQTSGTWRGKVIIQRSADNRITWEDFVTIGDTTNVGTGGNLNFTYASPGQEGVGVWVRVQYIAQDGDFSYSLKTDDPWKTLVKIIGYTDAKNVTAEVLDSFQDVESDYTAWVTANSYVKGNKVKIDGGITYSSTSVNLESIDTDLSGIVGSDFGGDHFWFITFDGLTTSKLWKLDSSLSSVETGFPVDISSEFVDFARDVAFYANNLYITGLSGTTSTVKKFNLNGAFESTELSLSYLDSLFNGIGVSNNKFYISSIKPIPSKTYLEEYTSSFNKTGISTEVSHQGGAEDIVGVSDYIYVANSDDSSIDIYDNSLNKLSSTPTGANPNLPRGISYDGVNIWMFGDDGSSIMSGYKYDIIIKSEYYECTTAHTSDDFFEELSSGLWSLRAPVMTTWTEGAFSDVRGWANAITFHEDRMWLVGSDAEPATVHASVSGDYYNFATSDNTDSAIRRIPDNPEVAQWLIGRQRMILGTEGGAIIVRSVNENALIDTSNIVTSSQAVFGASSVPAIEAGDVVVYPERSNKKIREIIYNRDEENIRSADMNILNNEILEGGVKELFLQQQPDQIIWAVDGNGDCACLTYERLQEVVGWSRFITNGSVESACRLPSANSEDEIWMCVNRNGTYTIERTKPRADADWYVDSATEFLGDNDADITINEVASSVCLQADTEGDYINTGITVTPLTDLTIEFKMDALTGGTLIGAQGSGNEFSIIQALTGITCICGEVLTHFIEFPYTAGEQVKVRMTASGDVYKNDVLLGNTGYAFTADGIELYMYTKNSFGATGGTALGASVKLLEANGTTFTPDAAGFFNDGTSDFFNKELPTNSDPLTNDDWDNTDEWTISVTTIDHGLVDGSKIIFTDVTGYAALVGPTFTVSDSTDDDFVLKNEAGTEYINPYGESYTEPITGDWKEPISTLSHLEGLEVRCLVDGVNDGLYTVSSGEITPTTTGTKYLIGLDYDSIMRTMPIEPGLMQKLPNSRVKGAVKAIAEFYPTTGGSIREKNKTGEIFDEVEFSGEKKFNIASDWTREKIIEIKQHLPYPMTILSLAVWTEAKGG